ncbi:hypothetical protein PYCCODRAFT_1360244, partial [Trametes coccinea BRFM310]
MTAVRQGYVHDSVLRKVQEQPEQHKAFAMRDGFIYTKNRRGDEVLCLPRALYNKRSIIELIIDRAHTTLGHLGAQRTSDYVRRWFWW